MHRGGTEEWEPGTPVTDVDEFEIEAVEEQVAEHSEIRRAEQPEREQQLELDRLHELEQPPDPTPEPTESPRHEDGWTPFIPTSEEPPEEPAELTAVPPPPATGEPSDRAETMKETESLWQTEEPMVDRKQAQQSDWLAETGMPDTTLSFPERGPAMRLLDHRPEEREAMRQRVSTLFPVPDTVDWSVGELDYDRSQDAVADE